MRYDSFAVSDLAERLNAEARFVEIAFTFVGLVVGAAAGYPLRDALPFPWAATGVAAVVTALLGYLVGRRSALTLRAFAQLLIAQVRIEQNTRSGGDAMGVAGPSRPSGGSRKVAARISGALTQP